MEARQPMVSLKPTTPTKNAKTRGMTICVTPPPRFPQPAVVALAAEHQHAKFARAVGWHFVRNCILQGADDDGKIYHNVLEQVERPLIKLALSVTSGNKLRTAALLGVNRNTLRARMGVLGMTED